MPVPFPLRRRRGRHGAIASSDAKSWLVVGHTLLFLGFLGEAQGAGEWLILPQVSPTLPQRAGSCAGLVDADHAIIFGGRDLSHDLNDQLPTSFLNDAISIPGLTPGANLWASPLPNVSASRLATTVASGLGAPFPGQRLGEGFLGPPVRDSLACVGGYQTNDKRREFAVIGGRMDYIYPYTALGDIWVLNVDTLEWSNSSGAVLDVPRYDMAYGLSLDGSLLVLQGGIDKTTKPTSHVTVIDTSTWSVLTQEQEPGGPDAPLKQYGASMAVTRNANWVRFVVFGGTSDPAQQTRNTRVHSLQLVNSYAIWNVISVVSPSGLAAYVAHYDLDKRLFWMVLGSPSNARGSTAEVMVFHDDHNDPNPWFTDVAPRAQSRPYAQSSVSGVFIPNVGLLVAFGAPNEGRSLYLLNTSGTPPITTRWVPPASPPASSSTGGASDNSTPVFLIVGIVAGVVVVGLAIVLVVFLRKRAADKESGVDLSDVADSDSGSPAKGSPGGEFSNEYHTVDAVPLDNEYNTVETLSSAGEYNTVPVGDGGEYNTVDDVPSAGEYQTDNNDDGGEYNAL
jgi:hypothetical protein